MTRGARIVTEARTWIGTPYLHQGSVKGAGTDCLGLVRGVWRAVLGAEPENPPPYTADWAEPGHDEVLLAAAGRWLLPKPRDAAELGDVLVFRMRAGGIAKHLGIQSGLGDRRAFVHAYSQHGVLESPLSAPWERRIAARFTFPQGA